MAPSLALPLLAAAQADPADPAAPAPAPGYQSAFSDYKPWQDLQPDDWRTVNEAVRPQPRATHGNHGAAPAAAPAAEPAASLPPGHGGHPMHGGRK